VLPLLPLPKACPRRTTGGDITITIQALTQCITIPKGISLKEALLWNAQGLPLQRGTLPGDLLPSVLASFRCLWVPRPMPAPMALSTETAGAALFLIKAQSCTDPLRLIAWDPAPLVDRIIF